MDTKFSINDIVVLKENDKLSNDQLAKIVGGISGNQDCGCGCKIGTIASENKRIPMKELLTDF